jgi:hypothetical protein
MSCRNFGVWSPLVLTAADWPGTLLRMISQTHYRPRTARLAGWWLVVVLGVLGSFVAPVLVRAGHVHEARVHADATDAGTGCGHRHGGGADCPTEDGDHNEDSPCDVCLKLTLATFTSIVGGSTLGLVLPRVEVVAVEGDARRSVLAVTVWRATSRGPPALA